MSRTVIGLATALLVLLLAEHPSVQAQTTVPDSTIVSELQHFVDALNGASNITSFADLVGIFNSVNFTALAITMEGMSNADIANNINSDAVKTILSSIDSSKIAAIVQILSTASANDINSLLSDPGISAVADNINFFDIFGLVDVAGIDSILHLTSTPGFFDAFNTLANVFTLGSCASQPCQNGGTCDKLSLTKFKCKCTRNYHGRFCKRVRCLDFTLQCSASLGHKKYMSCADSQCKQWVDCGQRSVNSCPDVTPYFSRLQQRCTNNTHVCRGMPEPLPFYLPF